MARATRPPRSPVFEKPDKARFEYRLDGHDKNWIEAGTRRDVHYSNLRPGAYQFHVRACDSRGVWNETGAVLGLVITPQFFQTWWFQGLVAGVLTGTVLAFVFFRLRVQRRLLALEREAALEHQRSRIAQDMHDELGASLTKIAILSEVAKREMEQKLPAVGHVDAISNTAREVVDSLGQIVWAVNPAHDTLESLCAYMREYSGEFFERLSIACEMDIPMDLPEAAVTAEFRRNVFLAVKEILTNVARHSGATHVRVSIRIAAREGSQEFRLEIADDGKGFDPSRVPPFSHGLEGVRKRIESVGGTTAIDSAVGTGTVLRIALPLSHR